MLGSYAEPATAVRDESVAARSMPRSRAFRHVSERLDPSY
jgi:hypothetical protein